VKNEKPSFDLVTICPPLVGLSALIHIKSRSSNPFRQVYGPVLQEVTSMKQLNTSSAKFYSIFNGEEKELTSPGLWLWVDVRDVARAHVAALVSFTAGRLDM
jgi:hypothetical protein